jgi:hypothetical protein
VVLAAGQPLWHPTLTQGQRTSLGHLADALIFSTHRSVCSGGTVGIAIVYGRAVVAAAIADCGAQS